MLPVGVRAQTARPTPESPNETPAVGAIAPLVGTSLPARVLDDLPAAGNLLSLVDAVAADVITDRVDTGGLTPGAAARMGGHGSTWTQTRYLLDGVDISNPDGSGTPFLLPGVLEWEGVDVRTGAMPLDVNAVGLAVSLRPRRPSAEWTGRIDALGSRSFLVSGPAVDLAPTILAPRHLRQRQLPRQRPARTAPPRHPRRWFMDCLVAVRPDRPDRSRARRSVRSSRTSCSRPTRATKPGSSAGFSAPGRRRRVGSPSTSRRRPTRIARRTSRSRGTTAMSGKRRYPRTGASRSVSAHRILPRRPPHT